MKKTLPKQAFGWYNIQLKNICIAAERIHSRLPAASKRGAKEEI